jgi:hypothetical protein
MTFDLFTARMKDEEKKEWLKEKYALFIAIHDAHSMMKVANNSVKDKGLRGAAPISLGKP